MKLIKQNAVIHSNINNNDNFPLAMDTITKRLVFSSYLDTFLAVIYSKTQFRFEMQSTYALDFFERKKRSFKRQHLSQ